MTPTRTALVVLLLWLAAESAAGQTTVRDIGSRLELFIDHFLIARLDRARLELHSPVDSGTVLRFDKPWEGAFCAYGTVIKDAERYRLYYRGLPQAGGDGSAREVTCYAESRDGIRWTKPDLRLFEVGDTMDNNVILAADPPFSHNFAPFLDARPKVSAAERFKALAGSSRTGLWAFRSSDAIRWSKWGDRPVITRGAFDSQNVAFWSESEQCYVAYFRTFKRIGAASFRWISRATSTDFVYWTEPIEMGMGDAPPEHLYTNQTHGYFRAPHIYVGTAARFFPGRRVLTEVQAQSIGVNPAYYHDCSDAVLITSRGGNDFQRTFLEGFIRPGVGPRNWVSRTNYPVRHLVQTGPDEMSLYVQHDYGQPTAHLRRYRMRLDGLASVRAPFSGGEMITHTLRFTGRELLINFATSAAGEIRVEIQDASGIVIPGFSLADSIPQIGNEIQRVVAWRGGSDLAPIAGKPVRLRFVMRDADLFALQFR
jgi:hypothetical protein